MSVAKSSEKWQNNGKTAFMEGAKQILSWMIQSKWMKISKLRSFQRQTCCYRESANQLNQLSRFSMARLIELSFIFIWFAPSYHSPNGTLSDRVLKYNFNFVILRKHWSKFSDLASQVENDPEENFSQEISVSNKSRLTRLFFAIWQNKTKKNFKEHW